jgi:hypothetical protein
LAISRRTGDFIPNIDFSPLEIIYNKPHPSILLHIKAVTMENLNSISTRSGTIYHLSSCSTYANKEEEKNFDLTFKCIGSE